MQFKVKSFFKFVGVVVVFLGYMVFWQYLFSIWPPVRSGAGIQISGKGSRFGRIDIYFNQEIKATLTQRVYQERKARYQAPGINRWVRKNKMKHFNQGGYREY